jgi:hypothetical protein
MVTITLQITAYRGGFMNTTVAYIYIYIHIYTYIYNYLFYL